MLQLTDALSAQGHVLSLPCDSRKIWWQSLESSRKEGFAEGEGRVGKFTEMLKCQTSLKRQDAKWLLVSHSQGIHYEQDARRSLWWLDLFIYFFYDAGDGTQGLEHARQAQ